MLLVGFMRDEVARVEALLAEMGAGDVVAVVPAGAALMGATLQDALEGGPRPYEQVMGRCCVCCGWVRCAVWEGLWGAAAAVVCSCV